MLAFVLFCPKDMDGDTILDLEFSFRGIALKLLSDLKWLEFFDARGVAP